MTETFRYANTREDLRKFHGKNFDRLESPDPRDWKRETNMAEIKAQLHSNDFAAAMATEATLTALWPGTYLKKSVDTPEEAIDIDDKGLATIITSNPDYVRFACQRQGYVAKIL